MRVHIEQDEAVYRVRASAAMKQIARDLRQRQTSAEAILWECLRDRRLDHLKFRRQHALENSAYVVDFLCYEARLVVELDGEVHAGQVEADAVRQANIEALGYRVLRFPNEMVHADLESVLTSILMAARPFDSPRPEGEGPGVRVPRPEGEGSGVRVPRPEEAAHGSEVRVITKWDIFYYVYGLLHHPGYRERYADNLKRELPRIPFAPDFWAFSTAGRKLADLHLHYEDGDGYDLTWQTTGQQNFRVEKMRLSRDKTALRVNDYLTLTGLPAAAFAYRLGNRSALEWIVDQYQVKTDKRSGIVSDPNGYSANPRYIVELVEKVVRVSVATVQIVNELAALAFR